MTGENRAAIRAAYLDGATTEEIAEHGGVSVDEAEIYLREWCGEGCPREWVLT